MSIIFASVVNGKVVIITDKVVIRENESGRLVSEPIESEPERPSILNNWIPVTYEFKYGGVPGFQPKPAPVTKPEERLDKVLDVIVYPRLTNLEAKAKLDQTYAEYNGSAHAIFAKRLNALDEKVANWTGQLEGTLPPWSKGLVAILDRLADLESAVNGSGEICSLATVRSAIWGEGQLLNRIAAVEKQVAPTKNRTAPEVTTLAEVVTRQLPVLTEKVDGLQVIDHDVVVSIFDRDRQWESKGNTLYFKDGVDTSPTPQAVAEVSTGDHQHGWNILTGVCYGCGATEPFNCDGCGKPIEGSYASFGGNWVPFVPAKNYHGGCTPNLQPAPSSPITPNQLRELHLDTLRTTSPSYWETFAARINEAIFGKDAGK